MRRVLFALTAFALAAEDPVERRLRIDIEYLASPALTGRGQGTPGLESALEYLQQSYRKLGLQPQVQRYASKGRSQRTQAEARFQDGKSLIWDQEISLLKPLDFTLKEAPLVFAGRGISTPSRDDLKGLDLKGKVAVILREIAAGDLKDVTSQDLSLSKRIVNLVNGGAAAILLLEDPEYQGEASQNAEVSLLLTRTPILKMPEQVFEKHVPESKSFIRAAISQKGTLGSLDLKVMFQTPTVEAPNLAVVLPGSDPQLKDEYIAVGAHFDHLGEDPGMLSLAVGETRKRVHPGADDNASGTALVMELARQLKEHPTRRSILFLHFSGEELGLLGSDHWARNPTLPLQQVKCFFNFDMVGRLDEGKPELKIGRLAISKPDEDRIDRHVPRNIAINHDLGIYLSASDHFPLATHQIPSVFYTTGIHSDYHRPSDTPEKIKLTGESRIEAIALETIRDFADAPSAPAFDAESTPSLFPKPLSIRKAIFGAQPSDRLDPRGLLLDESREGTPAAELGLRAGDVLLAFGGHPVKTLFDLNAILGTCAPGDPVTVSWIRDGKQQEAEVVLKSR